LGYYEEQKQKQSEKVTAAGVMEKYQAGGKICKDVLTKIAAECVAGASIYKLCSMGDKMIEEEVDGVYKNKKTEGATGDGETKQVPMEKGIGYPTTISVNNICGHYSPCKTDDVELKEGDLAKINMGVHFDGYLVQLGHTVVVPAAKGDKATVSGRKADVMASAWYGLQAAIRMLKPGNKNSQVTDAINKCCKGYNCEPLQGVLSHEVQRWLIDGNNVIINKETPENKVAEHEFGVNEIYVVDVYASSGEGKPKESELRIDVYKREMDQNADLKSQNSRKFFGEVRKRYSAFAFAIRSFEDELLARAGVQECVSKGVVVQYPVLIEKAGNYVAQFQWTVLISAKRIICFSSQDLDVSTLQTEGSIADETIRNLVNTPLVEFTSKPKPPPKMAK